MSHDDFDALFDEGVLLEGDLVVKAQLRVQTRPLRVPAAQALVDDLSAKYEQRVEAMLADIQDVLDMPVIKSDDRFFIGTDGMLVKANSGSLGNFTAGPAPSGNHTNVGKINAAAPAQTRAGQPRRAPGSGPNPNYQRPPGGVHQPGSRGGRWYRDDHGNVRYGDKPTPQFHTEAEPHQVADYYSKFAAAQLFTSETDQNSKESRQFLVDAGVLDAELASYIEWWDDNFDTFLKGFKKTRQDVEDAHGDLEALDWVMKDGTRLSYAQAIEAFLVKNVDCFENRDGSEMTENDVKATFAEITDAYSRAMKTDPKVQAAMLQYAEMHQRRTRAFYVNAESNHEGFATLASVVLNSDNAMDQGMRLIGALGALGVLSENKKGGVSSKSMRGLISPESALVSADRRQGIGDIFANPDEQHRLSASQKMAVYMASRLQDWSYTDGVYRYEDTDEDRRPSLSSHQNKLLDSIMEQLSVPPEARAHTERMLELAARNMADMLTEFNTGKNPLLNKVLNQDPEKILSGEAIDDHLKDAQKHQEWIDKALEAQENDNWELPATMQDGVWGGWNKDESEWEDHHYRDPEHPEKGVWEPMRYQRQYVNWMMHTKRGVIAADAGLGKTPTVIAFMETLRAQGKDMPAVIFLPPSLMEQWPQEIAKFAPDMKDHILPLNGMSLEERKAVLQSDMAKKAKYILISTGTLNSKGGAAASDAPEELDDGTGGTDDELVQILQGLEGAVFIDEVHQGGYKKEGNTRHEIAKKVLEGREYAFGMTATPMPNEAMDLYHLCNLFSPDSVGSQDQWAGKLAGAQYDEEEKRWKVSNVQHIAELNRRIKPHLFYKRIDDPQVVEDMKAGLPEKKGFTENRSEGDVTMSRAKSGNGLSQHDYFKEGGAIDTMVEMKIRNMIQERQKKIDNGEVDPKTGKTYEQYTPSILQLLAGGMRIDLHRQASISPALIDPTYKRHDGGVGHSPKLKELADDIEKHFGRGGTAGEDAKPIVVSCSYPGKAFGLVRKMLAERGIDPSRIGVIDKDVSPEERGYMQDKLNSGHIKVLLLGAKSGGAGLNLQKAANAMLNLDEPWDPATKRQLQGRVWRTGQKNTVHEKTYRTVGTHDMHVEQRIGGKQVMISAMLGAEPDEHTFDPTDDVTALLGRIKGRDFNEDTIRSMMEAAEEYDTDSGEYQAAKRMMQEVWDQNIKSKKRMEFSKEDFEPDQDAQKRLKRDGKGVLASKFDELDFRRDWEDKREARRAKVDYRKAEIMVDLYKKKAGDDGADPEHKDKLRKYEREMARLAEKFPDLDGGKAKNAAEASKKKGNKKLEEKAEEKKAKGEGKAKAPAKEKAKPKEAKEKAPTKKEEPKAKEKPEKAKLPVRKEQDAPAKKVHAKLKIGVNLHASKLPYSLESDKKVKGTKLHEFELAQFYEDLMRSKHKTVNDFLRDAFPRDMWDDKGGKDPYTLTNMKRYARELMDALAKEGHVSGHEEMFK